MKPKLKQIHDLLLELHKGVQGKVEKEKQSDYTDGQFYELGYVLSRVEEIIFGKE